MIKFDIDIRGLQANTLRESKRLAYSTATAINKTMAEIQREERAELDRRFTIRKNDFMYRLIKIFQFAKVPRMVTRQFLGQTFTGIDTGSVYGEIGIDSSKKRVLLDQFVEGGFKDPIFGKSVAVPVTGSAARPSFSDPVTAALQISRLNLQPHVTKTGKVQWKGEQRTFMIHGLGIFQRGGDIKTARRGEKFQAKGGHMLVEQTATSMLYKFVMHPRLKKSYDFVDIAERVFDAKFDQEFDRAYGSQR